MVSTCSSPPPKGYMCSTWASLAHGAQHGTSYHLALLECYPLQPGEAPHKCKYKCPCRQITRSGQRVWGQGDRKVLSGTLRAKLTRVYTRSGAPGACTCGGKRWPSGQRGGELCPSPEPPYRPARDALNGTAHTAQARTHPAPKYPAPASTSFTSELIYKSTAGCGGPCD